MSEDEPSDSLKGTTLEVYRFLLKAGRPVGVREVQRALNLSSSSVATYHLSKLENARLVKRDYGNYIIDKVFLENCVRLSRFLIPKYLFYAIFAVSILIVGLTLLRPPILTRNYFIFTITIAVFAFIFCYETTRVWLKGRL